MKSFDQIIELRDMTEHNFWEIKSNFHHEYNHKEGLIKIAHICDICRLHLKKQTEKRFSRIRVCFRP